MLSNNKQKDFATGIGPESILQLLSTFNCTREFVLVCLCSSPAIFNFLHVGGPVLDLLPPCLVWITASVSFFFKIKKEGGMCSSASLCDVGELLTESAQIFLKKHFLLVYVPPFLHQNMEGAVNERSVSKSMPVIKPAEAY